MEKKFIWLALASLTLGVASSAANAALISRWDFEEGSGTTAADSVGSNDGTLVTSGTGALPVWGPSTAALGTGLEFNGNHPQNGNAVSAGNFNPSAATGAFSVAAWVNWKGGNTFSNIAAKATKWNRDPAANEMLWKFLILDDGSSDSGLYLERARLNLGSAPEPGVGAFGSKVVSKTIDLPATNQWVHLTVTHDGTDTKFYFDGVSQAVDPVDSFFLPDTITPAMENSRFTIGASFAPTPRPVQVFKGEIDDVFVYSHAIGQSEIDALVSGSPSGPDADFDGDGDVDGADFLAWQRDFGGLYNATDLSNWESEFGTVPAVSATIVPEPSTWMLVLSCAGSLVMTGRFGRYENK